MSEERAEFLRAYDTYRVRDQLQFYDDRIAEYGKSAKQIDRMTTLLLAIAAACGALGAIYTDQNRWLGLLAAGVSAAAAAITSWGDIVGFSANSDLYRAAVGGLRRLRPNRPDEEQPAADDAIGRYMTDVEALLLGEVRTWAEKWGQEAAEPQPPDPPSGANSDIG